MKVWCPLDGSLTDGETFEVHTITSDREHFGNLVAEGVMTPEEYWPELVKSFQRALRIERQGRYTEWSSLAADRYRREWVDRWLADTEALLEELD